MPNLMESLLAYIREQAPRFYTDSEYRQNCACRDRHLIWLQDHLGPEELQHLEDYRGHLLLTAWAEEEALMRCALAAGVRLGSFGQLAE